MKDGAGQVCCNLTQLLFRTLLSLVTVMSNLLLVQTSGDSEHELLKKCNLMFGRSIANL